MKVKDTIKSINLMKKIILYYKIGFKLITTEK